MRRKLLCHDSFRARLKPGLRRIAVFIALTWLVGNVVPASAQTRPEAPPCDASRLTECMRSSSGGRRHTRVRGRLFDPRTGTNLTNQMIVIQGDRIVDVGPADRAVKVPAGARVIDLSAATVLPGLIDRHVHLMQDQQPNEARLLRFR